MKAVTLYVTCSDQSEARAIAQQLIKERLVACVNILPAIQSLYWWNDAVQDDSETAFFAKTTPTHVDRAIERIGELHSYDCPCVVSLPIEKGNPDYLKWIAEQTLKKD
ncbi:divalent-cation tolerance protein CutA [Terasakiella sp. SH-1]|uniref:divalent-cation tolerance protein CutA n=1 Tax=Terasakiella sp. SH-1 TaxID=2560057 RepID=UPI0010745DEB|nr:divalent-cation tolerance protein CutA [Terasakiella sp. SH-1]